MDTSQIKAWLIRFGYLDTTKQNNEPDIVESIKRVQLAYGLIPTGESSMKLVRAMELPRCGNPDHMTLAEAVVLYKWRKSELTYHLNPNLSSGLNLSLSEVKAIHRDIFTAWEETAKIKYTEVDNVNQADIQVSVGSSGRADGFDGPSNILAWCELPVNGTGPLRMKYDPAEPWKGRSSVARGILVFNTGCHEIGHANGLTHSREHRALMAPTYSELIATPQDVDDKPRMVARYGEVVVPVPVPTPVPTPIPVPIPTEPKAPGIEEIRIKYRGISHWQSYRFL